MTILHFNPEQIEKSVQQNGLKKTWINLIATRLYNAGAEFQYVLSDLLFQEAEILETDALAELSIGEIGVIYEYCVALVDAKARKDNGQFFTPDDVAQFMVKQTKKFPKGVWLDPCSGIGNLAWHLVNAQRNPEEFLQNRMVLSDKDELALIIARALFTISFQRTRPNLYHEIGSSFVVFDFLSVAHNPDQNSLDLFEDVSGPKYDLDAIPLHDYVIVNPPYLGLKKEDARFYTSKAKDLYAYFMENIIKTSKGFVSVTPQSFTNAGKFANLRELLMAFGGLKIYCFDNIPGNLFYGIKFGSTNTNSANSIRAAITVAVRADYGFTQEITSLLRWKTSERKLLFKNIDKFLTSAFLTIDFFPKVSSTFALLYYRMRLKPRLGEFVVSKPTEYRLYVPSAPRYFISALKTEVSRTSLRTLYFNSEEDLNRAYLILNSSLMYWWWRVRDGGMTLSLETLLTLPVPSFPIDLDLVYKLEKSEITNKVFKKNAGAIQENVKHDLELIQELNQLITPDFARELILTHENSELVQIITN